MRGDAQGPKARSSSLQRKRAPAALAEKTNLATSRRVRLAGCLLSVVEIDGRGAIGGPAPGPDGCVHRGHATGAPMGLFLTTFFARSFFFWFFFPFSGFFFFRGFDRVHRRVGRRRVRFHRVHAGAAVRPALPGVRRRRQFRRWPGPRAGRWRLRSRSGRTGRLRRLDRRRAGSQADRIRSGAATATGVDRDRFRRREPASVGRGEGDFDVRGVVVIGREQAPCRGGREDLRAGGRGRRRGQW